MESGELGFDKFVLIDKTVGVNAADGFRQILFLLASNDLFPSLLYSAQYENWDYAILQQILLCFGVSLFRLLQDSAEVFSNGPGKRMRCPLFQNIQNFLMQRFA